jgi:hypothetical protein
MVDRKPGFGSELGSRIGAAGAPVDPVDTDAQGLEDEEYSSVRPYMVTRGRTRPSDALPIEALVRATSGVRRGMSSESRRILELAKDDYLSVAELSAHMNLPVGVVRVLVGDLSAQKLVRVDGLTASESSYTPATTLSILESVLNGISAL